MVEKTIRIKELEAYIEGRKQACQKSYDEADTDEQEKSSLTRISELKKLKDFLNER